MSVRHLALIPARKGSKSIKDKNLVKLGGKTLVRWAMEPALKSGIFSRVIVATDYARWQLEIDDIPHNKMTKIEFIPRHESICQDDSLMIDVVRFCLNSVGGDEHWVWLLQPTSPFRTVEDFKKIKKILEEGNYESLISFKPQKEYMDRTYTWKNGNAHRISQANYKNKQEVQPQLHRSGNFYIAKRENLMLKNEHGLYLKDTFEEKPYYSYIMGGIDPDTATLSEKLYSRVLGTNIDDNEDLIIAKHAINTGAIKL